MIFSKSRELIFSSLYSRGVPWLTKLLFRKGTFVGTFFCCLSDRSLICKDGPACSCFNDCKKFKHCVPVITNLLRRMYKLGTPFKNCGISFICRTSRTTHSMVPQALCNRSAFTELVSSDTTNRSYFGSMVVDILACFVR